MEQTLHTRPATAADAEFIYDVRRQAFQPLVEQLWGWREEEQRAEFEAEHDPDLVQIVICRGQEVGYLRLEADGQARFLDTIALLPAHQGQGIGRELMRRLLRQAGQEKRPLRLHVLRINPALRLYQELGFYQTGGDEHSIYMQYG